MADQTCIVLREFTARSVLKNVGIGGTLEDRTPRRCEGVISSVVGGEAHALSWATGPNGTLRNPHKFGDYVVFFGTPAKARDAAVRVMEADTEQFDKANAVFGELCDAVGAGAACVPPYGPVAHAGCRLLKDLGTAFGSLVEDDLQLAFDGDLPALAAEQGIGTCELRRTVGGDGKETAMALRFECLSLVETAAVPVKLTIRHARLDLGEAASGRTLLLDMTVNHDNKQNYSLRCPVLRPRFMRDALQICGKTVYRGACRGFLPFHISVATLPAKTEKQLAKDLAKWQRAGGDGRDLVAAIAALREIDKAAAEEMVADYAHAQKLGQSLLSLATEFQPDKLAVGIASGLLTLTDDAGAHQATPDAGAMRLVCLGQEFALRLQSESGGAVDLTLVVETDPDAKPARNPTPRRTSKKTT